jgi:hypothetical protein
VKINGLGVFILNLFNHRLHRFTQIHTANFFGPRKDAKNMDKRASGYQEGEYQESRISVHGGWNSVPTNRDFFATF